MDDISTKNKNKNKNKKKKKKKKEKKAIVLVGIEQLLNQNTLSLSPHINI